VVFGIIVDQTGNWTLPFAGSICLQIVGAIATFWMHPERGLEAESPGTPVPALELL
jgi:cyanate permease